MSRRPTSEPSRGLSQARHEALWACPDRQRLRFARRCYGHLAGILGVELFAALDGARGLRQSQQELHLTEAGREWLGRLGFHPVSARPRRRYAFVCCDGSERRAHLAGQLGEEILQHLLAAGWLQECEGRVLELTGAGERELLPHLFAFCGANPRK